MRSKGKSLTKISPHLPGSHVGKQQSSCYLLHKVEGGGRGGRTLASPAEPTQDQQVSLPFVSQQDTMERNSRGF